jgi:O-acetyl-ADP-ribose deacetylase (regulator of RNase III)
MFQKISIFILNRVEYEKYKYFFKGHPVLEIHYGNIFNHKADCIVTAGQSFGMMDGGIDGCVNYFMGMIEPKVQETILNEWQGELPVGMSILIDTPNNTHYKFLCYAPTMRIPCDVSNSTNAYLAFRGALIACSKVSRIQHMVCPLLCGGIGNMPTETILNQMKHAFDTFMNPTKRNWKDINNDHKLLLATVNLS